MKRVRIASLGAAKILGKYMAQAMKDCERTEFVGVASRDPARAREVVKQFGGRAFESYDALLRSQDVDAVYIPLPIALHEKWSLEALKHGKHILVEKSFSNGLAACERVLDLARKNNLLASENFMCAFHRQHHFVRSVISDGKIGEPKFFQAWFGCPGFPKDDIRYSKELGGGVLGDMGTYTVFMSRFFFGEDPQILSANLWSEDRTVDEFGSVHLNHASGVHSALQFGISLEYRNEYTIWGTKGYIRVERAYSIPPDQPPVILIRRQNEDEKPKLDSDDHFVNRLSEFAERIESGDFTPSYSAVWNQAVTMENVRNFARSMPTGKKPT
jgi:dTDP-3,4-didehydro-2,6-dideoxy-alpha-D-glucose 3-reductase